MNSFNDFLIKETIFHSDEITVSRGIIGDTKLIIHQLPLSSCFTNNLIQFLKTLFIVKSLEHPHLLQIYGFCSTATHLYIEYIDDDDLKPIILSNMTDDEKTTLINNISDVLFFLHKNKAASFRVKPSSVFVNSKGIFKFGLLQPRMMIVTEKEDEMLPFQNLSDERCDIYQFGLFLCTLITGMSQENILHIIWDFTEIEMRKTYITQLCKQCLSFDIHQKLTFENICDVLKSLNTKNYFQQVSNDLKEERTLDIIPTITTIASYVNDLQTKDKDDNEDSDIEKIIEKYATETNNDLMKYLFAMILLEKKEVEKSFHLLEECSNNGLPQAQNNLAKLLFKSDKNRAIELFKKSAESGYVVAEKNYAQIMDKEHNSQSALSFIKDAADKGFIEAMRIYSNLIAEKEPLQSFSYIVKAARRGEETALHMAGLAYEKGVLFPKNDKLMLSYWRIGAALGSPLSLNNLGKNTNSMQESIKLWTKSAEMGTRQAQYNLAVSYILGRGVEKNPEKAFYWMTKSAEQNYPNAMTDLGLMYIDGIGCEKNERVGQIWCRRGAEWRMKLSVFL